MADRQWLVEGVQIHETGEEEFVAEGVQLSEDQPAVAGAVTHNLLLMGVG